MSNRTIVEFNHDLWDRIRDDPDGFVSAIREMLNSGVNGNPENKRGVDLEGRLARFGVTTTPTSHHSEERRVIIGKYINKQF